MPGAPNMWGRTFVQLKAFGEQEPAAMLGAIIGTLGNMFIIFY
jgi:hypothetical protein